MLKCKNKDCDSDMFHNIARPAIYDRNKKMIGNVYEKGDKWICYICGKKAYEVEKINKEKIKEE